jgi:NAD-dependent deacetylase
MARVVILSGAGISAESGISTFRDSDGLWEEYDVKVVCNFDSLEKHEALTLEFYDKRRSDIKDKEPNYAHKVVANLKKRYPNEIAVITQNVDNLFEKAGLDESEVIHLHGFLPEVRCQNPACNKIYNIGYEKIQTLNGGKCPTCNTKLRPNIVFFGESAPMYEKLNFHMNDCELLVVIGTSGNVINTDFLTQYVDKSILNNLEPSPAIHEGYYDKVLYKKATEAADEIALDIESFLDVES